MTNEVLKIVLGTIIPSLITGLGTYVISVRKKTKALENGMLSLLRAEIIRQHDKYTARECCPIYAKDALEKAYASYHSLGGNGTITKIYNDTMALPEEQKEN